MSSVWSATADVPHFPPLMGDKKTEVLVIGGGMAGMLCAYFLKEHGVDVMLAEAETIGGGITKNTTAKITSQHGLIYAKLLKEFGAEKTRLYLEANQKALAKYAEMCEKWGCDFEKKNSYVYSLRDRKKIEREVRALEKIGFSPLVSRAKELPFSTTGAVGFPGQAQFHPLKFLARLAEGLEIYEHTRVLELAPHRAVTKYGKITFDKLVVATHFPLDNKHGLYFMKMYQQRSYVIALEGAEQPADMYVDESGNGLSFRRYGNLLLLGGGGHRTGKKGGGLQVVRAAADRYYPGAVEKYHWAAQDCMTLDAVPYIGSYSRSMPGCFVATGFNKWGMTSCMVAAGLLADMIEGKRNPYREVFAPARSIWKQQLFVNGLESTCNLLTPTTPRCPHLGCALKWNRAEHSWDCPCHGSRFDRDGKLLDNPANGNLKSERGDAK